MATIINNAATAEESILRVHQPLIYVGDKDKSKALAGGKLYFGVVGRDPELEDNQKIVYLLQEDGSAIPIDQPVIVGAGGYPEYNGSPALIAVNGSHSYKVLDKNDVEQYYFPRIEANDLNGYSGVIVEESKSVTANSVNGPFEKIEATTASFYASTDGSLTTFNGRLMRKDVDYTVVSTSIITLSSNYPDGTIILGRQMDPTGQIVNVGGNAEALSVYQTITVAMTSDIKLGETITINGGLVAGDGLGGLRYLCVAGGTGSDDGENFIDLDNGNQLQLIANNMKLQRYSEKVLEVSSVAGNLNLDLEQSNVFDFTPTEAVTNILFLNANSTSRTVTLKFTQVAANYGLSFTGIQWDGGVVPTVSTGDGEVDVYVFTTFDGVTWIGSIVGQEIS